MKRVKPVELVAVRVADGAVVVLGEYTTARAALNAAAFRAAFGPAGVAYRAREKATGRWVAELARA